MLTERTREALKQKEMQQMMQGAFILTIASFIAKLLSAIYRVPFQNVVGDEGFYVYQQVYPIYGIAMTLALSGMPQFISKYVAEKKLPRERQKALDELYPIIFLSGIGLWLFFLLFSHPIASLMGDRALGPLIQVVSFTFLLMPGLSMYRGSLQGQLLMEPTAISQVIEQLIRVSIILLSSLGFRLLGWTVYRTGTVAMSGAVFGGIAALFVLHFYERRINGRSLQFMRRFQFHFPPKRLLRRFVIEGGLVTIYTGLLILFQLIDSFLIKNALIQYGYTEQAAKIAKGVYDRGQPIVQLGLVIATALSATFLPGLTRSLIKKEQKQFLQTAKIYLRLTTSLALAASIGLALLMPYMNYALFKDYAGNSTLVLFVFAVALTALIQAYQSIAQSKNVFRSSLRAAGIGLLIKFVSTSIFTQNFGTVGSSISTLLGLFSTLVYLIKIEEPTVNAFWKEKSFGRHLCYCLLLMTVVIIGYYSFVDSLGINIHRFTAFLICLGGVSIGATVFVIAAIRLRLFTIREWLMLPFGGKILRIHLKKEK